MRGKQLWSRSRKWGARITPAHAGKTLRGFFWVSRRRDHPRACGENLPFLLLIHLFRGSPPRMRGKRVAVFHVPLDFRITPAHAGKTVKVSAKELSARDHPRACGENSCPFLLVHARVGSPPRMRGKPHSCKKAKLRGRITPAHAGKTPQ